MLAVEITCSDAPIWGCSVPFCGHSGCPGQQQGERGPELVRNQITQTGEAGRLSGLQTGCDQQEQILIRVGIGKQQLDAPGIAQYDGTDPQQLQSNGRRLCAPQFGPLQGETADPFQ